MAEEKKKKATVSKKDDKKEKKSKAQKSSTKKSKKSTKNGYLPQLKKYYHEVIVDKLTKHLVRTSLANSSL